MLRKYKTIVFFLLLILVQGNVKARTEPEVPPSAAQRTIENSIENGTNLKQLNEKSHETSAEIDTLKKLIDTQRKELGALTQKIEYLVHFSKESGMTFEQWAGIILTAVAVIVTTLGVGMALIGFIGFKEALREAEKIAKETASKTSSEVAKNEICIQMSNGGFDDTIEKALDKRMYSSVSGEEYDSEPRNSPSNIS